MSILVLGGSGTLGRQIVQHALKEGYQVKCLLRQFSRGAYLKKCGAELVCADLSRPSTIPLVLKGITVIIDSATNRSQNRYTAETVDWRGKLALLEAAKVCGVKKFIYFSIFDSSEYSSIPLLDLKVRVEDELQKTGLNYTIYQCSGFLQGLIQQYGLRVLDGQTIWLRGNSRSIAYLDAQDVAKIVIHTLNDPGYDNKRVALLGEKFWTPEEVVQLCERLSGKTARILYIPGAVLGLVRKFVRFFESYWNVADRLQFGEVSSDGNVSIRPSNEVFWSIRRITLESYFQEFFSRMLKKLKEADYQESKKSD
jgi:uncharacterized protein YbjT (DUF2867 family)